MQAYQNLPRPSRNLNLHPGINFSCMDVGGDLGGLVFAVGSVVTVLIGLPSLALPYVASVGCGLVLAVLLAKWHRLHPGR